MGNLRDRIAAIVHSQWAHWMLRQIDRGSVGWDGELILSRNDIERWTRQAHLHYDELSESEKESDLRWADKYLDIVEGWVEHKGAEHPTWHVFLSDDEKVYTVEADYYRIEEDGSLAFFRLEECDCPRPVGVVAAYSWALARKMG